MNTLRKILSFIFGFIFLFLFAFAVWAFLVTFPLRLDETKLKNVENNITVFDEQNDCCFVCSTEGKNGVNYEELKKETIAAFVCAEDRSFFEHKGLNYKRMVAATLKNIKSLSFKEGASTISQQLVKNTQLSAEKTISRKLKEIKLTKELEKSYTKEEIMEMYLNTIYFGHSAYGIDNASRYYFDKSAKELTISQSAALAALIKSPNNYSPFKHPENYVRRRNYVLKTMISEGVISEEQYREALAEEIPETSGKVSLFDQYYAEILNELEELAELPVYDSVKVYTYFNARLQNQLEELKEASETDKSYIVIDAKTGGIKAYCSSVGSIQRLPGSTLKPLLIYAPALEMEMISPATPILDEPIDYGGYSPQNFDKKTHGYVSARVALSESYNIPAVKILNQIKIENGIRYLEKMNLPVEQKEKNLSLALGGMTNGYTLKALCGAYTTFCNDGNYLPPKFIKRIEGADGRTIYREEDKKTSVFSMDTTTQLNDMLMTAAREGTAKRLKSFPYEVCAKTGTNGDKDAYCIAYTSKDIIGVWLGNADNQSMDGITGGGLPTNICGEILTHLYKDSSPAPFRKSDNVKEYTLDKNEYVKKHAILLCDVNAPIQEKTFKEIFSKNSAPKKTSTYFSRPELQNAEIFVKNGMVIIELCQAEYIAYVINRCDIHGYTTVYNGKSVERWIDRTVNKGERYLYSVTPYYEKFVGETVTLPTVIV